MEIGVIGVGVMGKSLSRNLARNGYYISVYNRNVKGKEENVAQDFTNKHLELKETLPFDDLNAFVNSIAKFRKIILMIHTGFVDDVLKAFVESPQYRMAGM